MLHCKRVNYIKKIWMILIIIIKGDIERVEQIFPDVVEDTLMDDEYEETHDYESDIESDSETDMIWSEGSFYLMSQ